MTRQSNLPNEPVLVQVPANAYIIGIADHQVRSLAESSPVAKKWLEKGYFEREQPSHVVRLDAFLLAKHPVTVAEYRIFVADLGYQTRAYWTTAGWQWLQRSGRRQPACWDEPEWTAKRRLPVIGVSWYEALAYCCWLAERTGRPYRLPSEAEWEAAARGPDGYEYPWGDTFDASRCNWREAGAGRPLAPGSYSPDGDSPFGLCDMAGNVSEWTRSLFRPYPTTYDDGRDDPHGRGPRVIRGGSWFSPAIRVRCTARGMNVPDFCDHDVGFRLAADT